MTPNHKCYPGITGCPLGSKASGIDQVIVGGESGPGARPMQAEWVRSIRNQCKAAGVAFFFKQWGGVRKHETGRTLDGKTWDEMPSVRNRLAQAVEAV